MRNDETGEFYTPTTSDQKLYKIDGRLKAEIDVYITSERTKGELDPPSIAACRHAVLQIANGSSEKAYVIYDRLLGRIVNGVYYMPLEEVLESARHYNEDPDAPQDMIPNGLALGLKYPKKRK
jgi:hypothetical protein